MPRLGTLIAAVLLAAALTPATASAVVGGKTVKYSAYPWFAQVGSGCGGTLVAPDRVVTSAHCITDAQDLDFIRINGQRRTGVRFAFPPGWQTMNADITKEDFALVLLDRPVTGVTPATIGTTLPKRATLVGKGGSRYVAGGVPSGQLRTASLRPLSDAACAARLAKVKAGNERYAENMVCAFDPDGRKPYVAACDGDSGGALIGGTAKRPVLLGVTSWVGEDRCGTDGLPTVFAEAARYADLITAADPGWAPVPAGEPRVTGAGRVGETLACTVDRWEIAPTRTETGWFRLAGGDSALRAKSDTYTVVAGDAGHLLACAMRVENAFGRYQLRESAASTIRIAR